MRSIFSVDFSSIIVYSLPWRPCVWEDYGLKSLSSTLFPSSGRWGSVSGSLAPPLTRLSLSHTKKTTTLKSVNHVFLPELSLFSFSPVFLVSSMCVSPRRLLSPTYVPVFVRLKKKPIDQKSNHFDTFFYTHIILYKSLLARLEKALDFFCF